MSEIKGTPLLHTKMMVPATHQKLVHRKHLIEQLDGVFDQCLILISAPPGYGKTTLIADWIHEKKVQAEWLTLDNNDNDTTVIYRYLSELYRHSFTNNNSPKNDSPFSSIDKKELQALLTDLINSCSESTTPFTLVLDDYQVIHNPQIHSNIKFLIDHAPGNLRIVLITRSDPPIQLGRLRANKRICEIHAAELAFSLAETNEFFEQSSTLKFSENQVNQLYAKTEGWIAGLQLASLSKTGTSLISQPGVVLSAESHLTIDYLVEEVISVQSTEVQEFLLRTSILNNLHWKLCDYLIQSNKLKINSRELLETLYHNNLFLTPLDENTEWFRYHSLFAAALRHLLAEKYPEDIVDLYRLASEWCDQNGFFESALTYANFTGNRAKITKLLEKYAIEAVKKNYILEVLGHLRSTDETIISSSPILSVFYSWEFLLQFDVDASELWLERAETAMQTDNPDFEYFGGKNGFLGIITSERAILESARGNMNKVIEFSDRTGDLIPGENEFSFGFGLVNQGLASLINGEIHEAERIISKAIQSSQKSGNWFVLIVSKCYLGILLLYTGQLNQAQILFYQLLDFFDSTPEMLSTFGVIIYKSLAEIALLQNRIIDSEVLMQKSIEFENSWLNTFNDFNSHLLMARLFHSKGDERGAKKEFLLARQFSSHSPAALDDLLLEISENKWYLQHDQLEPAQKWLKKTTADGKNILSAYGDIPNLINTNIHLLIARLYLTEGRINKDLQKLNEAKVILTDLLKKLKDSKLLQIQIEANCLLAIANHELNQIIPMLDAIDEAIKKAETEEIRQPFLDEGIAMSKLLIHYLSAQKQQKVESYNDTRSFVSDLLFRFSSTDRNEPFATDSINSKYPPEGFQVEILTSRELEVLSLTSQGRSNSEIALQLHISINTVKRHLNNIFMKLGVTNRTQAVRFAQSKGLIH